MSIAIATHGVHYPIADIRREQFVDLQVTIAESDSLAVDVDVETVLDTTVVQEEVLEVEVETVDELETTVTSTDSLSTDLEECD